MKKNTKVQKACKILLRRNEDSTRQHKAAATEENGTKMELKSAMVKPAANAINGISSGRSRNIDYFLTGYFSNTDLI